MSLVPSPNYSRLQEIRLAEKKRLLFKGLFTSVSIDTTAQWASSKWYTITEDISEKRFHPSIFRTILITIFIVAFLLLFYLLLTHPADSTGAIIFPMAITLFFLGLLIYYAFFDKKRNYPILINPEGISLGDDFFRWTELKETAILQIGAGRGESDYLVLLFPDDTYKKYPTRNFLSLWSFKNAIAAYIEYFKRHR